MDYLGEDVVVASRPELRQDRPFRVLIAGAGVAGLVMSHALQKANIDHVVLEKGEIAPAWGASISMWGHGCRILQQIDCFDAMVAASTPLKRMYGRTKDGKPFVEDDIFPMIFKRNGYDTITMERRQFLQILFEQLPDKSTVRTGSRVADVIDTEEGVEVKLADGTSEFGDVLVGCDGVHSIVRELMWRDANQTIPDFISAMEKRSLVTTYNCLIGVAKTIPGLGSRDMTWVHNSGLSFLFLSQPEETFFFVHFKLPKEVRWPSRLKYTQADADAAAASVADHPISDSLLFGELWKNRVRGHLIALEEGVFDHWTFGRTALVGDSVHKVTPNLALGGGAAMESVCVLTNEINKLSKSLQPGERPTKAAVSSMLKRYETARKPRAKETFDASALMTRLQAYDGFLNHFIMRYVVPIRGLGAMAKDVSELVSGAAKFDFLPIKYSHPASVPWKDEVVSVVQRVEKKASATMQELLSVIMSAFSLTLLSWVFFTRTNAEVVQGTASEVVGA